MESEKTKKPSRFFKWLIFRMKEYDSEYSASGDLLEYYNFTYQKDGGVKANLWCFKQMIISLPSYLKFFIIWRINMLKNYIKVAFRNIRKQKAYSFINISGLAIGLTCFIFIMLWIRDELNYDRYHERSDRIYRLTVNGLLMGNEFNMAVSTPKLAPTLLQDFPEVTDAVRFYRFWDDILVSYKDKKFVEKDFLYADKTVFDVFTFPFIKGDPKTALENPNTIVITESAAKKYFGDEEPVGKTLTLHNVNDFLVTGVIKDIPKNSHFRFDLLGSFVSHPYSRDQNWISNNCHSYIVLREGVSPSVIEAMFPEFILKYVGPQVKQALGMTVEEFYKNGGKFGYALQPLTDIHLKSDLQFELEANGDIKYIYIFSAVAFFVLLIACINFMNLSTARSYRRAKEVGIRKVVGSEKSQIRRQFLFESVLISVIAVIVAIIMIQLLIPLFNELSGKNLDMNFTKNAFLIPGLIAITLIVGFLSGSYPAFVLSSFKPVSVLKTGMKTGVKRSFLRKGMVILQFSISIFIIVGTFIVYEQLNFISNKKLGFNKDQVLVIKRGFALGGSWDAFKNELKLQPAVSSVSGSNTIPGEILGDGLFRKEGAENESFLLWRNVVDYDYLQTLQHELVTGRNFSKNITTDISAILINETAAEFLGWENPVGKRLFQVRSSNPERLYFTIIGVLKDFHFESIHRKIRPMFIRLLTEEPALVSCRLNSGNVSGTLSMIKEKWSKFTASEPFEYYFLDNNYDSLYRKEMLTGKLLTIFSILTVFISCLGLFGLAAFMADQRKKEFGIRKVLGSSVTGIISLMSREFLILVSFANLLGWPIAYYFMNNWLQNFAYHVQIKFLSFIGAGLLTLLIALLTVSFQAVRAAFANPVDSLRNE
ncbi:ABC transporter permease [candidate division KSB1 bacterium]